MSYENKIKTLRMLKKEAASFDEYKAPLLATGLGAAGGLGFNDLVLGNKSLKSRILASIIGGGLGLGLERLAYYGANATTKPNKKQLTAKEKISKALQEKGIESTKENINAVITAADKLRPGLTEQDLVVHAGSQLAGTLVNKAIISNQIKNLEAAKALYPTVDTIIQVGGVDKLTSAPHPATKAVANQLDDLYQSNTGNLLRNLKAATVGDKTYIDAAGNVVTRGKAAGRAFRTVRGNVAALGVGMLANELADRYVVNKIKRDLGVDKKGLNDILDAAGA